MTEYLRKTVRELSGRDLRIVVETGAPGSFEPMALGAAAVKASPAPPAARPVAAVPTAAPYRPPAKGAPVPARKIDDAERQALKDRALLDPSVRTMMELFGGELVDVEPLG